MRGGRFAAWACLVGACLVWGFGARAAPSRDAAAAGERTKVLFFFDTEDFIQPRSADAIRDIADLLAAEGVKGHFAMVGYLCKKLVDWRRFDVLDALRGHHVGTQTLYHSLHPNITESTDVEDFDAAYLHAMDEESRGIGMIQAATGQERMWCSVLPGNGNTIVAMYLYADLGIPFFGGGTGMYEDATTCGDIWYCNQRHLTYAAGLRLESFIPGSGEECDVEGALDKLARQKVATLYMHPHMAVCTKHWDWVFAGGNLYPFGAWPYAPARPAADTAAFYERLRAFVRRLKADARFEITDCPSLLAAQRPRRAITLADVPAIRSALLRDLGPVRAPADWCVADCFLAAVGLLRGETRHEPGKVHGFLYAPEGVKTPVRVTAAGLRRAAAQMDVSRFLPPSIVVDGQKIGPADFLFAALEVLETGAEEVTVAPREQLGDIARHLPKMAAADFRGTWIYAPDYKDAWTSNRLRWQFWTFRYEHPLKNDE
ncbi:MAG: hypothetical protein IJ829_04250 [Kiritimatiellae bacterium]|nr:hypothetical protein [Kiritimatiellia bacterium]